MSNRQLIEEALHLDANERFIIIETLLKSLDTPDEQLNNIWTKEATQRLKDYENKKVTTISFDEVFNHEN